MTKISWIIAIGMLTLIVMLSSFLVRVGTGKIHIGDKGVEPTAILNTINDDGPVATTWRVTYYPKNGSGVVLWWPVKKYFRPGPGLLTFFCADGKEFTISGDYLIEQL